MAKRALITGITGQDGSYLAELLLEKGYEVHGIVRRSSSLNRARIDHLRAEHMPIFLHYGDLTDASSINRILRETKPDEIYKLGFAKQLALGNLDAKRDWGYAKDYVVAMWKMLQAEKPDDYVVATGETHTVRQFCEVAFGHVGLDWQKHVVVDPKYFRPTEVD